MECTFHSYIKFPAEGQHLLIDSPVLFFCKKKKTTQKPLIYFQSTVREMNFFSVNSFLSKWSCQELDRPGQSGGQLSGCGCYGCVRAWWALQLAHQKLSVYYIRAKEGCKKVGHCTTILTPYVLVHAKAAGWYICRLEGECKGPCV